MKKVCFVTAVPLTVRAFLQDFLLHLSQHYAVSVASTFSDDDLAAEWPVGVRLQYIPLPRRIAPFADARALAALYRFFRREHFDLIHSVTPKAGLLATAAGRLAGAPCRVHCFTGQVWATRQGIGRFALKQADRVIVANATHVMTDSHSQRAFLETEGVLGRKHAHVIGQGSISGVDLGRFHADPDTRSSIREELGVPDNAFVMLFVGRLNADKGIPDLAKAFERLANEFADAWLVLVGPDEGGMLERCRTLLGPQSQRLRAIAYTSTPERYMAAADLLVLPSYREGFGSVVIEAAACGVPAVASRIYGLSDAVVDGETGLLHPPRDIDALHAALRQLYTDPAQRGAMARNARDRAVAEFSKERVTAGLLDYYDQLLTGAPRDHR